MQYARLQSDALFVEVPEFERFLKVVGFRRVEGTIYGLLVLTSEPLTSDEICKRLDLAQGTVSAGLSRLIHWGAIESHYDPNERAQTHIAVEDSLRIVATIFQKREQAAIAEFRNVAERCLERALAMGDTVSDARVRRLKSIILTCNAAEAIMTFVIALARADVHQHYSRVFKGLPKALDVLVFSSTAAKTAARKIRSKLARSRR